MQKVQRFEIWQKLYSLNDYRNEHFHKLNAIKREWANATKLACIWNKIEPVEKCQLSFVFVVPDRKRRDVDNYAATVKMVIDGLVAAEVLLDDSFDYVQKVEMTIVIQAKTQGVKVTIQEVEI
jgi:Holliday junction resolvase RusA-like endonuclease